MENKRYNVFKTDNHYEIDDASSVESCRIAVKTKSEANEIANLLNKYGKLKPKQLSKNFDFSEKPKY